MAINKLPAISSKDVLSGYLDRSWAFLAELQQSSGMEFVIGESQGSYLWNIERTHRLWRQRPDELP